jgi:predicted MFS family arabinose efflux permease
MGGWRRQLGESAAAVGAVMRNPSLRRLELAWASSIVGHFAYLVAVSVFAFKAGGAAAVGLIYLLRMVPAALVAPFSGLLADRYRRERVLLVSASSRVALVGAAAAAVFIGADPWVVYGLAITAAIVQTPLRSAQAALTPALCSSPAELTAANTVASTVESVASFIGPAIGGLLLGVASIGVVFSMTAGLIAVCVYFTARLRIPAEAAPKRELEASTIVSESLAGFKAIGREPPLRVLIGLLGAQTFVAGAVEVYIVVLAIQVLGLGESGVGYLNSAFGIGAILGGIVAFGLTGTRRLSPSFLVGVVLWGAPLVVVALWSHAAVALLLFGVMGLGNTLVDVSGFTLVQRAVPDDVLARVFGVIQLLWLSSVGVGAMVAPRLISWLGTRDALIATGVALVGLVALFAVRVAVIDGIAHAPDQNELRLLGGVPIFAPLAGATLEHLAGRLVPITVEPGTEIVRQGAAGDRFYIVAEGELDVSADGGTLPSLGPGDYFGEIALLRDVPRTASVTARTRTVLYGLDRDDFLAAVSGFTASVQAAERVVSARLATSPATGAGLET